MFEWCDWRRGRERTRQTLTACASWRAAVTEAMIAALQVNRVVTGEFRIQMVWCGGMTVSGVRSMPAQGSA